MTVPGGAELAWLAVGFAGQLLFTARFLWQWIVSERNKRSTIPLGFWYCSILGGLTLLSYAIYRRDPVFIVGQSAGLVVYLRNLQMIYRERSRRGASDRPA